MDQRTRKLMTMHNALHPRDDVDGLYVSRKEGRRGLSSIEGSVDASIQQLEDYIEEHEGGLITAIKNDTDNTVTNRMTITRKQKWVEKQLYGRFKRLINDISHEKTWTWLRKGNFKRETESLLISAQNNAIRTNLIKVRIDKVIHWEMCKKFKFDHTNKWYMHNPATILEKDTYKLLRDLDIQTDHLISARRPDLIVINKKIEKLQNCILYCTGRTQNKTERKWKEG